MTLIRRLSVWSGELLAEALLFGLLLVFLSGPSNQNFLNDLLFASVSAAVVFMVGTGYLLTTAVFGVIWRSERSWVYPTIAAALFLIHYEFFDPAWKLPFRVQFEAGGALIVFVCTLFGGRLLRIWTANMESRIVTMANRPSAISD